MSRRLLLVDDDDSIREIARLSLERVGGWEVVEASSGLDAVAALERGESFDAILLDVMMPVLDGPSTLARLRAGALPPTVPAVFLTAKLQPADCERLRAAGAAGVIAKPFDPMTMPGELERLLGGRLAEVDPALAAIWSKSKPAIERRVASIEAAIEAIAGEDGAATEREAAIAEAHRLAGLLGTFGLDRGTELARELEVALEQEAGTARLYTLATELRDLVAGAAGHGQAFRAARARRGALW